MRNEKAKRAALVKKFHSRHPGVVVLRHEDIYTAGHPDISATGWGRTLWVETKDHPTGRIEDRGVQELTMARLARSGMAVYVVFDRVGARVVCGLTRTEIERFERRVGLYDAIVDRLVQILMKGSYA